jgi:hypothetical protein
LTVTTMFWGRFVATNESWLAGSRCRSRGSRGGRGERDLDPLAAPRRLSSSGVEPPSMTLPGATSGVSAATEEDVAPVSAADALARAVATRRPTHRRGAGPG